MKQPSQSESLLALGARARRVGRPQARFFACENVVAILCAVLGVFVPLGLARAQGDIESLLPGIVKIVASGAAAKTGTGFVVARTKSDTYIVTAAHVVEGADRISVFFYDRPSKAIPGTASHIQASDPRGLALVTVSGPVPPSVTPLALASDVRMSRGESVKGVGHQASHGDWGVISGGVASREGSLIRIQAPVEQQTSGGPVILEGRVVGVFVSQQPNVGIAITALAVRDYLDGALPPGVQAAAPPTPEKLTAPDTRRTVINGPKPLYAPYKTGDVFQECADCPEMVVIVPDPKGFTIGSPESEQGRQTDEKQFGPIKFAKPYAIGKFEVTRAQFNTSGVQPSGSCYTWDSKNSTWQLDPKRNWEQPGFDQGSDHPVVCVNWNEVQEYLK